MKWLLKNLLLLVITLTVSTAAAKSIKFMTRSIVFTHRPGTASLPVGGGGARFPDAPVLIFYQPRPARTAAAIRDGITGTVKLHMMLNRDFTVSDITPVEALPDGLTEQAIEAAQQITFRPAVVNGQFTNSEQLVEFYFDSADREVLLRGPNAKCKANCN